MNVEIAIEICMHMQTSGGVRSMVRTRSLLSFRGSSDGEECGLPCGCSLAELRPLCVHKNRSVTFFFIHKNRSVTFAHK